MAFETTREEILKQAIELKKLYDSTRIQSYKDQELRLRRIVVELDNLTLGASDLNSLTDVTISSPTNGQVLTYNSTTSQWENQAGGGSGYVPYTGATGDVNLGTHQLLAARGTFANNGSSDTLTVNHTSGSGYGVVITKGGNNEALYVNKTSGSGNAMTVVGGRTSLVDLALSSVSNAAGDFLTLSGGVVHRRTAAQVLSDISVPTPTLAQVTTAGNTTTNAITVGRLTTNQSVTASGAIARGVYFNNTLVAAANNDVLVGLDINPTFTNGAFTGVTNLALRVQGNTEISRSGADTQLTIARGGGASLTLQAKANSTSSSEGVNLYWTANTWLKFVLGSSVVANFSNVGNLLVGTSTDAGYKLDVNGSTRVKGAGTTSATTALLVQNSALFQLLKVTDDGQCQIGGNGLTTFPLQVYGNSGLQIQVGNSFFSYDVVRTIRFINPNNGIPLNHEIVNQVSSTDNSNYVYFRNQTIQTAGSAAPWKGISIETSVNTQTSAIVTQLSITPTLNLQANTTSASIQRGIYYNPTITTLQTAIHRAIETTSGDVIFNGGNVGIGLTPIYKLDVNGAVRFQSTGTSSVTHSFLFRNDNSAYGGFTIGSSGQALSIQQASGYGYLTAAGFFIGSTNSNIWTNNGSILDIKNAAGTTTYLRVASTTGNLLIGTTTDAGYKLDVNGSTRVKGVGTTDSTIAFLVQNNTGRLLLQSDDGGSTRIGGPTARLYVGVESGGATHTLVVNGSGLFSNGGIGNAGGFYIDQGGTSSASRTVWYDGSGSPKNLITGDGNNYITSGNFGIGTTTPTDIFHIVNNTNGNKFGRISAGGSDASAAWVAQNDQVDNVVYRVFGSGVSGTQMGISLARSASLLANLGGSGKFLLGTFSNTDFVMGTGNAEKMRIVDSTGNILIATTTDLGNKLEVNGTINATAYKINNIAGYTGILNIPMNPPGQQNVDIQSGIIVNIF
jgi:hypothetical protein